MESQMNIYTFKIGIIDDLGVGIPFTLFESELLKVLNVTLPNYILTNGHSLEDL